MANNFPGFKPIPEMETFNNTQISAFNTGMNLYECISYLQGYVQVTYSSQKEVVDDWNNLETWIQENLITVANEKTQEILQGWLDDGTLAETIKQSAVWAEKVDVAGDVMSGDLQFQESTGVYGTSASGQKVNLAKTRHVGSSNYVDIGYDDSQAVIYSNEKPVWSNNGVNKDLITEEDISNILTKLNTLIEYLQRAIFIPKTMADELEALKKK